VLGDHNTDLIESVESWFWLPNDRAQTMDETFGSGDKQAANDDPCHKGNLKDS